MSDKRVTNLPLPAGLGVADVYYTLFRQKWKIFIMIAAGICGAVGIHYGKPPTFTSEAQLLIKYINVEKPANAGTDWKPDPMDPGVVGKLKNEVAILRSLDLAQEVATNIGAERILSRYGGGANNIQAAMIVQQSMTVERAFDQSTVLSVSISLQDDSLVQPLLRELVTDYMRQHVRIHSVAAETYNTLIQTQDAMKSELEIAQADYRKALSEAGVIDFNAKREYYIKRTEAMRANIDELKVQLGTQRAILKQLKLTSGVTNDSVLMSELTNNMAGITQRAANMAAELNIMRPTNTVAATVPPAPTNTPAATLAEGEKEKDDELTAQYTRLSNLLDKLYRGYQDVQLQGIKESAPIMVEKRAKIQDVERQKKQMEKDHPSLLAIDVKPGDSGVGKVNGTIMQLIATSELKVTELEENIRGYSGQLDEMIKAADELQRHDPKVDELDRKVKKLIRDYEDMQVAVDHAKIDATMADIRQQNIVPIQSPTPPMREASKTPKLMATTVAVGVLAGLAWAFITELLLDHSVRRSKEIEGDMGMKLFLTIPRVSRSSNRRRRGRRMRKKEVEEPNAGNLLPAINGQPFEANGSMEIAPWDTRHTLHDYFEALRDRLITYFETNNLTHKPKLVAVTGASEGCGATTLAVGLAASLSETGDGNVLLVDMNMDRGAAQHFYKGEPTMNLEVALSGETKQGAMVLDHLYVVGGNKNDKLFSMLPKRFANLMPKLQSSDYDYIIFDMPAVARTGVTQRLAGFMDMMLLVVESEKTQRHVLRQSASVLNESKAKVSVVLNKTKTYVPAQLHQEF